jgi:hypothetical protein
MDDSAIILKDSYVQMWHVSQPSEHFGHFGATGHTDVTCYFYEKSIKNITIDSR